MTITKIEDLGKVSLSPFDYYYRCEEVKGLVDHLQSKLPIWHKGNELPLKDGIYNFSKSILFIINNNSPEYLFSNGYYSYAWNKYEDEMKQYTYEDIKYWCYLDDLMKTLPEDK